MLRIENSEQSDKLPIEYPLQKMIKIYAKRLGVFLTIVIANFVILGLLLGLKFLPRFPSPRSSYILIITVFMIAFALLLFLGPRIIAYRLPLGKTLKIMEGKLTVTNGISPIAEFYLFPKEKVVISQKELMNYPQLGLRKLIVSPSISERRAIDIQVTYYNRENLTMTLLPNSSVTLNSGFVIVYEISN